MRERPILFSGPMVRALLEGRKTQTRRIIKPQPPTDTDYLSAEDPGGYGYLCISKWEGGEFGPGVDPWRRCPYGQVGDRLWVKESAYIAKPYFGDPQFNTHKDDQGRGRVVDYAATMDPDAVRCAEDFGVKKSPSIHMPRWASRLTLEVVSVRAERLQDITEEDAAAELGLEEIFCGGWTGLPGDCPDTRDPIKHFAALWDSINGKRAPWASNPWVWVISFRRVQPETGGAK